MGSVVEDQADVLGLIGADTWCAPDSVAVRDQAAELTYAELVQRADRVAGALARSGVKPGALVGLATPRSAALVVGALGVLRAGCAYVAIDPAYPPERVRWMLVDAQVAAVVAEPGLGLDLAGIELAHIALDRGGMLTTSVVSDALVERPSPPAPGDAAYVVYTSGSTGQPKGVTIEHVSLRALVDWHCAAFELCDTDRCTQIASPGFDAAVWEIWPCLSVGASLHIVPEHLRVDPLGLRDWLVAERITVGFVPTAIAEGLIALEWPAGTPLRALLTGGDALARRPRADLPFTLVNNYGVSEATVVATSGAVSPDGDGPPSLGRPIAGVLAEVVDEHGAPVAAGADGELMLGGALVGRGYLGRPELTAERFVADERGRWYRTGDRMRVRPDGDLEFLGRLDDQLSIRGFRVEPGEIIAALTSHPAVGAGAVIAAGSANADLRLVAGLVAAPDTAPPSDDELTAHLAGSLPDHMRPSRYVWLESLPLTVHGKVDGDALRGLLELAPGIAPEPAGEEQTVAPEPAGDEQTIEQAVASIVAELLELETVATDENFFLLGGHSMLGAQLIVRLEERYGVEIPLRFLFDNPTPAQLAAEVQRQAATATVGPPS